MEEDKKLDLAFYREWAANQYPDQRDLMEYASHVLLQDEGFFFCWFFTKDPNLGDKAPFELFSSEFGRGRIRQVLESLDGIFRFEE